MFCPSCGTAQELSYCTRCGANLNFGKTSDQLKALNESVESTVWALVVVTIAVLGIMIGVIALLKQTKLGDGVILLAVGLIFALLFGIDSVLIWQLLRINKRATGRDEPHLDRLDTRMLKGRSENLLDRHHEEHRVSAVENTTRTLEHDRSDRRE